MLQTDNAASSTPSSEDIAEGVCPEGQLNASIDSGEYEVPSAVTRKPGHRRLKTVSLVKDDARRVLERFLLMSEVVRGGCSLQDSSDVDVGEHQYAIVADQQFPHDQMPTPYQPMGSEESLDIKSKEAAFDLANPVPVESDYVDCQMFLAGKTAKLSGTRSLHTLGILTHSPGSKHLVQHPPKVKSKPKRTTALDSSSSSSTEDYEDYGNELLYRKKKSFFRWASERIQSFRYQSKKTSPVAGSTGKKLNFTSKSDVPLPPPPTLSSTGLHRDGSERSKSSSTPNEPLDQSGSLQSSHHGAELETLMEERKRPGLVWRKSDVGKERKKDVASAAEDKSRDGRSSVFDGLLRQFRRGSAKLKGKRGAKHRSHSADTVTIRRPTRESMLVVQQLVAAQNAVDMNQTNLAASEYESDVATSRLNRIEGYALATPPLPAKLSLIHSSQRASRCASRQKMNLEGLISCRPQMPTPQPDFAAPAAVRLADATDGSQALASLESCLLHKSSKPFADKSEHEKEELYEKIAEQLAAIADRLNLESPRSLKSSGHSGPEDDKLDSSATERVVDSELQQQQQTSLQLDVPIPRPTGDSAAAAALEVLSGPVVAELVQNARHGNKRRFQQIVSDSVGTDTGWQAIARMFRLTQSAVQLAGMGTAVAIQIKELTLNYFEDRFADWIVDQGGWESMVEETNTELDSELD